MTNINNLEQPLTPEHKPVLLAEVLEQLSLDTDKRSAPTYLDGTAGLAGHLIAFIQRYPQTHCIGLDQDPEALRQAKDRLHAANLNATLVNDNFRNLERVLFEHNLNCVDRILLDLGWGTHQLSSGKGLSFNANEPLDMSFSNDPDRLQAVDLVNTLSDEQLADIIYHYGEEPKARIIARAIVTARQEKPLVTTDQLRQAIETAVRRNGRLHPATKTFQALRIAVNDELDALREGIKAATDALCHEGRLAVISFHSLEDRIVKHLFRDYANTDSFQLITKKPLTASQAELNSNPRARSAKLRVIEKK